MRGTVVLSHGMESGPDATKVTAMAAAATALGWREVRPDYRDLDALKTGPALDERIARTIAAAPADGSPVVFAGSSLGAFASGLASLERSCLGVFLLAPALAIPGYPRRLDVARVPLTIVHGWDDELIPANDVIAFAAARKARTILVDDSHRLVGHVEVTARWFGEFLAGLGR